MAIISDSSVENGPNAGRRLPNNGIDYPLHFFNQLSFSMPETKREMFVWAKRLANSGIMDCIIDVLSRYPITKVIAIGEDDEEDGFWTKLLNQTLSIQSELITNAMEYYTYGNCVASIVPPFERYLKCDKCGSYLRHNISQNENALEWRFVDYKFVGTCKSCKHKGVMKAVDEYIVGMDAIKRIVIKRWPIMNITIREMSLTGHKKIYYTIEKFYIDGIKKGDKFIVASVPLDFIKAVSKSPNKAPTVGLANDCTYHYKHESTTEPEADGLGKPLFMSAWKDVFMTAVLRKAQECIIAEHMVPRKFVFPQANGSLDPFVGVDGDQWRTLVTSVVKKMQNDPNDIGILPSPLGYQQIGGDGKQLSITEIIEYFDRRIITMLGIPSELLYGGMQYSGMNVSLRMLENKLINGNVKHERFLQFMVNTIASRLQIQPPAQVKMEPFRLADDVAKNNNMLMLAAQQKISYTTAFGGMGIDLSAESKQAVKDAPHMLKIMESHQSPQAVALQKSNVDASVITNQNQGASFMQQQDMQATMNSLPGHSMSYVDPEWRRNELARMSGEQRAELLNRNRAQMSPEAFARYQQEMTSNVDPQPEQKPPTRDRIK